MNSQKKYRQSEKYKESQKKYRRKKTLENPNYNKERHLREIQLHPDLNKKKYAKNLELHPDYNKKRSDKYHKPKYRENVNKSRQTRRLGYLNNKRNRLNACKSWRETNPEKYKAIIKLSRIFIQSDLKTDREFVCALCENEYGFKIHKHHFDYSLWNWFIPLCHSCHTNIHNIEKRKDSLKNHRIDVNLNKRRLKNDS